MQHTGWDNGEETYTADRHSKKGGGRGKLATFFGEAEDDIHHALNERSSTSLSFDRKSAPSKGSTRTKGRGAQTDTIGFLDEAPRLSIQTCGTTFSNSFTNETALLPHIRSSCSSDAEDHKRKSDKLRGLSLSPIFLTNQQDEISNVERDTHGTWAIGDHKSSGLPLSDSWVQRLDSTESWAPTGQEVQRANLKHNGLEGRRGPKDPLDGTSPHHKAALRRRWAMMSILNLSEQFPIQRMDLDIVTLVEHKLHFRDAAYNGISKHLRLLKSWKKRFIVLSTNALAHPHDEQDLSGWKTYEAAKRPTLCADEANQGRKVVQGRAEEGQNGSESVGEAAINFVFDVNHRQEPKTTPYVYLHCFRTDTPAEREQERLALHAGSSACVATSPTDYGIDGWILEVRGHLFGAVKEDVKQRRMAQEATWLLRFDNVNALMSWLKIVRSAIISLEREERFFHKGRRSLDVFSLEQRRGAQSETRKPEARKRAHEKKEAVDDEELLEAWHSCLTLQTQISSPSSPKDNRNVAHKASDSLLDDSAVDRGTGGMLLGKPGASSVDIANSSNETVLRGSAPLQTKALSSTLTVELQSPRRGSFESSVSSPEPSSWSNADANLSKETSPATPSVHSAVNHGAAKDDVPPRTSSIRKPTDLNAQPTSFRKDSTYVSPHLGDSSNEDSDNEWKHPFTRYSESGPLNERTSIQSALRSSLVSPSSPSNSKSPAMTWRGSSSTSSDVSLTPRTPTLTRGSMRMTRNSANSEVFQRSPLKTAGKTSLIGLSGELLTFHSSGSGNVSPRASSSKDRSEGMEMSKRKPVPTEPLPPLPRYEPAQSQLAAITESVSNFTPRTKVIDQTTKDENLFSSFLEEMSDDESTYESDTNDVNRSVENGKDGPSLVQKACLSTRSESPLDPFDMRTTTHWGPSDDAKASQPVSATTLQNWRFAPAQDTTDSSKPARPTSRGVLELVTASPEYRRLSKASSLASLKHTSIGSLSNHSCPSTLSRRTSETESPRERQQRLSAQFKDGPPPGVLPYRKRPFVATPPPSAMSKAGFERWDEGTSLGDSKETRRSMNLGRETNSGTPYIDYKTIEQHRLESSSTLSSFHNRPSEKEAQVRLQQGLPHTFDYQPSFVSTRGKEVTETDTHRSAPWSRGRSPYDSSIARSDRVDHQRFAL